MPTIIFATGFEHRIAVDTPGTSVAATSQLWESVTLGGTASSETRPGSTGDYSLSIAAAANTAREVSWQPAATTRRLVGSFYFRLSAIPTGGDFRICSATTTAGGQIFLVNTSGALIAEPAGNAGDRVTGPTLTAGVWYRLDFDFDTSGTQHSIAWAVDGAAQTTATATDSPAAQDMTKFRFGTTATTHTNAVTALYDDAVFSYTGADYPLGAYTVKGFSPDRDVDISQVGTGSFVDAAAAAISAGNPAWDNLWDTVSSSPRVEQTAIAAAGYIEVGFAPASRAPDAVTFIATMRADSTSATNGQVQINDGGTLDTFTGLIDPSESSNVNVWKTRATRPNGGTAWTLDAFNALGARIGYSTDANPDVWFCGLMLEAAFKITPSSNPALTDHYRRSTLIRS